MAQRSVSSFKSTKNTRYTDNSSGGISEQDSRDMFEDVADSFLNRTDDLLDEDDMASDSATKVPSQQSVKAYVDNVLLRRKLTIPSTDVLTLNTSPVTLIPAPGTNKAIRIISLTRLMEFNSTQYSLTGNTIVSQGGLSAVSSNTGLAGTQSTLIQLLGTTNTQNWALITNQPVIWRADTSNPTDGDSDFHFDIIYHIVELPS